MYSLPVAVDNDEAGATNAIIKEVYVIFFPLFPKFILYCF